MVVRDEGKDLMLGMLKVILMFKKVRKIVICVDRSIFGKYSFKFV